MKGSEKKIVRIDASKICKQEMRERDGRSKRYASKRCGMIVVL